MTPNIKLSSVATHEFWEIPILFEDEHILALDKPPFLLTSTDRYDPERVNLLKLLHKAIADGKPWAKERGISYLMNAHRLDFEASGVLLLAKTKPTLIALASLFGEEKPMLTFDALVQGSPAQDVFEVGAPIGAHPVRLGVMRIDRKHGKKSRTLFEVAERFEDYTLLKCRPLTHRTHQVRVHLGSLRFPIAGDGMYGGRPLLLSRLKRDYRLKPEKTERPLLGLAALHAAQMELKHPVTGQTLVMTAEWPKDFKVAIKYLRRYNNAHAGGPLPAEAPPCNPEQEPLGELPQAGS